MTESTSERVAPAHHIARDGFSVEKSEHSTTRAARVRSSAPHAPVIVVIFYVA